MRKMDFKLFVIAVILLSFSTMLIFSSCNNRIQSSNNEAPSQKGEPEYSDVTGGVSSNKEKNTKYKVLRKPFTYNIMDDLLFPDEASRFYGFSPSIWIINEKNQIINCTTKSFGSPYKVKHYYTYNQEGYIEKAISEVQGGNNSKLEYDLDYEYDNNQQPTNISVVISGPQLSHEGEGDKQYISYSYNDFQKPSEIIVRYEEKGSIIKTRYISLSYNENDELKEVSWYFDITQEYTEILKYIYNENGNLQEVRYNRYQVEYPNENCWILSYDANNNIVSFTSPPASKSNGVFDYDSSGNLIHYYMNYFITGDKYNTDERTFNNENLDVDDNGNLLNEESLEF